MIELRPGVERLVLPAQFGVRLLDLAGGRLVCAGLRVRLWPPGQPERAVDTVANRAGVFVAQPLGYAAPPRAWTVEVRDHGGSFLPLHFTAQVPGDEVAELPLLSPPLDELPIGGVPLFSSPARVLAAGFAALYADVRDGSGAPAAWAVAQTVSVGRGGEPGATLGWGMANRQGSLFVPIRPPRQRNSASAGPDQPWSIRLTLRYGAPAGARVPDVPHLEQVLRWPEVSPLGTLSPPAPLGDLQVQAGQTLVLRTAGSPALVLEA